MNAIERIAEDVSSILGILQAKQIPTEKTPDLKELTAVSREMLQILKTRKKRDPVSMTIPVPEFKQAEIEQPKSSFWKKVINLFKES